MKNNCVYRHRRNDTNEVFYVGVGVYDRPYCKSHRSTWWKRIEAKAGRTVEILAEDLGEEDAFELECLLISEYGLDNLCNLTAGGERGPKGYKWTDEQRRKFSKACLGRPAYNKGIPMTDEQKAKISDSKFKIGGKLVLDMQTGIYYESVLDASFAISINKTTLSNKLNGRRTNNTTLKYV